MNGRVRSSWPETAMNLEEVIAKSRSEDPYVQVGACAIKYDNTIVLGYNGPPSNVDIDWSDREARRPYVLHAESNVLDLARPLEIKFLAVTHMPCCECLKRIAKYKIEIVYYRGVNCLCLDVKKTTKMADFLGIKLINI